MQCPVCHFENIPGQDVCVRCRAVLRLRTPVRLEEVTPPRSKRSRMYRRLDYGVNRFLDRMPLRMKRWFPGGNGESFRAVAGSVILSILPGLGQWAGGNKRRGTALFFAWCLLGLLTANFYGGTTGAVFMGLLVAFHVCVGFDAALPFLPSGWGWERYRPVLVILIGASVGYGMMNTAVRKHYGFMECSMTIAPLGVQAGDVLIVKREKISENTLLRGDVVAARSLFQNDNGVFGMVVRGPALGRVMGLSGDRLTVGPQGISVNGKAILQTEVPAGSLPLPESLLAFEIPADHAYVVCPMANDRLNPRMIEVLWRNMFVMGTDRLEGRCLGVYLPFWRRHFY